MNKQDQCMYNKLHNCLNTGTVINQSKYNINSKGYI